MRSPTRAIRQGLCLAYQCREPGQVRQKLAQDESAPSGPWRTGTQFRELRDMGVRKTEVLSEIAELEPNRLFVVRSKTGPGWLGTWIFEPEGAGTRLRWTGQLTMKGFARLFDPLVGRQMRSQVDEQFANLPGLIENEIPE